METGFDIIIVSTRSSFHEELIQKQLRSLKGQIYKPDAIVITVAEDWKSSAGNGLGTLYAYSKALEKAKYKYGIDLYRLQQDGASAALYHTAGQEKNLFPLVASEENSAAAIKLPGNPPTTLLETVIRQTNQQFSQYKEGRLSVFWGNQLFFPSKSYSYRPQHPIEVYCQSLPGAHMDALAKRQSVLFLDNEEAMYRNVADTQADNNCPTFSDSRRLAASLGSFSLSLSMTMALMTEFERELHQKKEYMETGKHFWMPLTFNEKDGSKSFPYPGQMAHFTRMAQFREKFQQHSGPLLQGIDIGESGLHWDFGSTRSYAKTVLKLASLCPEGHFMRAFFGLRNPVDAASNRVIVDNQSVLINCRIRGGTIRNSVLIGVDADSLEIENSVIVNSRFSSLNTSQALLYHVNETAPLKLAQGTVRSDVFIPSLQKYYKMYSHINRPGISDWNTTLPQNVLSFSALHDLIHSTN
jgi:hypothetical protein